MDNRTITEAQTPDQRKASEGETPPESPPTPLDKPDEPPPGTIKLTVTVEDDATPESPEKAEKTPDSVPVKKAQRNMPEQSDAPGEKSDWRKEDAPPAEDPRPKQPLDALYIEIEEGIQREAALLTQVEQLKEALDEALEMATSLHRKPLMETVVPLEHRLLPNVSDDDLNEYVVNGWEVVDVQWVVLESVTEKVPVLCPCAHMSRPLAQSKPTEKAADNKTVMAVGEPTSQMIKDLKGMTSGELVAMTEGMPVSFRQQLMNAQLKHKFLDHIRCHPVPVRSAS